MRVRLQKREIVKRTCGEVRPPGVTTRRLPCVGNLVAGGSWQCWAGRWATPIAVRHGFRSGDRCNLEAAIAQPPAAAMKSGK